MRMDDTNNINFYQLQGSPEKSQSNNPDSSATGNSSFYKSSSSKLKGLVHKKGSKARPISNKN